MNTTYVISMVQQFSKFPGGRFRSHGEWSGQRFREEHLVPALRQVRDETDSVVVQIDGVAGLPNHFLDEAFMELVYTEGMSKDFLRKHLRVETTEEDLREYAGRVKAMFEEETFDLVVFDRPIHEQQERILEQWRFTKLNDRTWAVPGSGRVIQEPQTDTLVFVLDEVVTLNSVLRDAQAKGKHFEEEIKT